MNDVGETAELEVHNDADGQNGQIYTFVLGRPQSILRKHRALVEKLPIFIYDVPSLLRNHRAFVE